MILSAGVTVTLCAAFFVAGGSPAVAGQGKEIAVLQTSLGTFEIELYRSDAPKTVENFVKLAQKKTFNGIRFHRVSKGFVIQSGDPLSGDLKKKDHWGSGGTSIYGGKEFADELNASTPSYREGYKRGVVAMANRGPNTNTSQFFVMLVDRPEMQKNYTIFGKVVSGMEVVDKIGAVELDPPYLSDGRPKTDVMLKKVTIKKAARPGK
jgi:cyclophilin family peptidyl-prolyl cis-trans isomerase